MSDTTQLTLERDRDTPRACGYCGYYPDSWDQTPQGRHSCPACGAIPADEQRERES